LLTKFGFDDPQRYLLKQDDTEQAPAAPTSPMEQLAAQAQEIGGAPLGNALQEQILQGNATDLASSYAGLSPSTVQGANPQDVAGANAYLQTPTL
jgi:hypothetical protein